jgi:hypothetical protein
MQAPHNPVPQPNLVPVSFKPSLITQSKGVSGGASVDAVFPFTVKFVAIATSPDSALRHGSRACVIGAWRARCLDWE